MPRYVIERDIPQIGSAEREALRQAAQKSNGVLAEMQAEKKPIQWEHSYVAGDKTFCIYLADDVAAVDREQPLPDPAAAARCTGRIDPDDGPILGADQDVGPLQLTVGEREPVVSGVRPGGREGRQALGSYCAARNLIGLTQRNGGWTMAAVIGRLAANPVGGRD